MAISGQAFVVAEVKAELESRGVALSGPCGAFEITRRVAWRLRDRGAGLLTKPSGNNCQGFAVDIVAFADGSIVDMLIDGGKTNGPTWNVKADKVDPSRWRTPADPGDAPVPPIPATQGGGSEPGKESIDELANLIEQASARIVEGLAAVVAAADRVHDSVEAIKQDGIRVRLR